MKESTRVLVALGAGVAGGTAIAASGSAPLLRAADLIAPIGALWVNAIRMTVIPLVVSLLITGVASATDVKSVGRLGGRTLLVFVLLLAGTAIIAVPFARPLFALLPPHGVASGQPDRGRGHRRDGAADPVHPAPRARYCAQLSGGPRDSGRPLPSL